MNLTQPRPVSYINPGVGALARLVRAGRELRLLRTPDFGIITERAYIDEGRYIRVKPHEDAVSQPESPSWPATTLLN